MRSNTWVDGGDPRQRAELAWWRAQQGRVPDDSGGAGRFRDNGELRYSQRLAVAHAPVFHRAEILRQVLDTWQAEFHRTSTHRFRADDDAALHVLYTYAIMESRARRFFPVHLIEHAWRSTYAFVSLAPDLARVRDQLAGVSRRRPKFFCLNDDLGQASPWTVGRIGRAVARFFEGYFPEPSSFEQRAARPPAFEPLRRAWRAVRMA